MYTGGKVLNEQTQNNALETLSETIEPPAVPYYP